MQSSISRRNLLKLGGLLGFSLPSLLQAAESSPRLKARAKAVIFLHQFGGPSHIDTFDLKPNAAEGVRSLFEPIASTLPGVPVCELLPRMAKVLDKVTQVRTVSHNMKNHNSATYYSLTGHAPPLDDIRLRDSLDLFPAYGAIVDRLAPVQAGMPTYVAYPHVLRDGSITPGQHASFLGKMHNPLLITQDPNGPDFRLPELGLPAGLSLDRIENRREVLKLIDQQTELLEFSATAKGIDQFYEKALTMLTSPKVKQAFDLSAEPQALRDQYGRTTFGQGCLLARRLVEAGAKFVNVYFAPNIGGQSDSGGWDTHGFNGNPMYPILKKYLVPLTDQVLPTLLTDLDSRGLLDDTLVVWMGEFGRTPRPDDLAATMFHLLGIDPHTEVRDALDRPFPIALGQPISGILT